MGSFRQLILIAMVVASATSALAAQNIVQVASDAGLTVLLSLVTAADLAGPLTNGESALTVLAPTDQAFANLAPAIVSTLTQGYNKDWLTTVLTYHVLPDRYPSSVVRTLNGAQTPATLEGSRINVTVNSGNIFLSPAIPDPARVTTADVTFFNGDRESVVHVIDAVLVPPSLTLPGTIVDVVLDLVGQGQFKLLLRWLQEFDNQFINRLGKFTEKGYTVFAPTDKAIRQLPARLRTFPLNARCKKTVAKILRYHIVEGAARLNSLRDNQRLKTLQGSSIKVDRRNGNVFVDDAKIVRANVRAANGIIHAIDEVLIP